MNKIRLASFVISFDLILLTVTIFNDYYNPYNQVPPFNQNYYDSANIPIYPNKTPEEKLLTEKIEAVFRDDPILAPHAYGIEVYSLGNEVTLSGLVNSDRIKLRAESKAKNILGVKKVTNLINVEKTK